MQKTLLALVAGLFLLVGSDASAQSFVKLWPNGAEGTINAITEAVSVENARSMATIGIQVVGTFTGTLSPECTVDGTTWVPVPVGAIATPSDTATTITAAGLYVGNVAGCASVRVIATAWTIGDAVVDLNTVQVPLASSASVSLESAELSVGAQPASDPHAVQCSNGSVDSPCLVTGSGTAGTAASGVVTVQGIASMTPVIVTATNLDVQIGGSDTLTVSGTVTANLSATDNAVLDDIADGITVTASNLDIQSGGADLATAAAQTTGNTSLSTIAGDTTDIETAIEIIDNSIGPVNAGAATATASQIVGGQYNLTPPTFTDGQQGSLQLNSAGALLVTGGGGGTEYVVNAAAPANPTGNAAVVERDDALSALTEVEGDWTNLRSNANGALWTAVDGTVTVTGAVTVSDGSGALNVIIDSGAITLPTGASTAANQTTIIGHLDGLETNTAATLTSTNFAAAFGTAGTADTQVMSIQGIASMTPILATATQSGTWNIGTVTTVTGVTTVSTVTNLATIGTSVTPGTSAAHLGKAEDAAHASADTGVMALGVRRDTPTALGADNDYIPATFDSAGRLWTNPFPTSPVATSYLPMRLSNGTSFFEPLTPYTHDTALPTITTVTGPMTVGRASATAPTNVTAGDAVAGWFLQDGSQVSSLAAGGSLISATGTSLNVNITGGAASGGTALTDGATFTAGSTSGTPVIGFYESSPTTCTAGDGCAVGLTTDRELKVALYSSGSALTPSVDYTHDTTLGTVTDVTGPIQMGRSSQAAPTDVSADGEAAMAWFLRNGSQVVNLAAGSTLITSGNGAASGAIRVTLANDSTGVITTADDTGAEPFGITSAATTNAISVKASTGRLFSVHLVNTTATLAYLRLYNLAAAPTCSSATGYYFTIPIPASTDGAGVAMVFPQGGIAFATGIAACITGGGSSTDNTAATTGIYGALTYK